MFLPHYFADWDMLTQWISFANFFCQFLLPLGLTIFLRVLRLLESEQQLSGWSFPVRKAITGACFYLTTCKDAYQHDPTYPCESCSNTVLFGSQYDSACRGIASLKQLVASCHGTTIHFVGIRPGTGRDVYRCQLSKESTVAYEDIKLISPRNCFCLQLFQNEEA